MNPVSTDIKNLLVAESTLGLTFATDLFIGKEPLIPGDCVTIFDTPGMPDQLTMEQGEDYFYPSIQIRVRNSNYLTGWSLIESIRAFLHGLSGITEGGSLYTLIQCVSGPAMLDWDENGRVRFIVNFNIQRR